MSNKVATAANPGERFESPRPAFQQPANAELLTPQERDNSPAKSLSQQAREGGNESLAKLIAKGEEAAKMFEARQKALKEGRPLPSAPRKPRKKNDTAPTVEVGSFGPEDVLSDRDFIIRTRSSDIHSDEMRRLFWANGGEKWIRAGLGYAAAYTNLRNDKMKAIRK